MESIVLNGRYNIKKNFWEENSDLTVSKCVKDFYDSDTSKNKEFSSGVMWAIYFIYDYKSRYFKIPLKERISIVEKDYLKEEGFFTKHEETLNPIIELYEYLQKDSELRYLDTWQKAVEARRLHIQEYIKRAEKDFKPQMWKGIDALLLNSEKILEQKDVIMKRITDNGEGKIKGDQKLSLLAQREIVVKRNLEDVPRQ